MFGQARVRAFGEEALADLVAEAVEDGVGQLQDGLGGAVVLLQLDDPGAGKVLGKSRMFFTLAPRKA
jgi:hypothetical protein